MLQHLALLALTQIFLWHWTERAHAVVERRAGLDPRQRCLIAAFCLALSLCALIGLWWWSSRLVSLTAATLSFAIFWGFIRVFDREAGTFLAHRRNYRLTMGSLVLAIVVSQILGVPGFAVPLSLSFLIAHQSLHRRDRMLASSLSDLAAARQKILALDAATRNRHTLAAYEEANWSRSA